MTTSTPSEIVAASAASSSMRTLLRQGRMSTSGAVQAARSVAMAPAADSVASAVPPRPGVFSREVPPVSPPAPAVLSAADRLRSKVAGSRDSLPQAAGAVSVREPEASKVLDEAPGQDPGPSTAAERLRRFNQDHAQESQLRQQASADGRTLAAMRSLTVLLCAVYARPGSSAKEIERIQALATLSERSQALGRVLAQVVGDDVDRNRYVQAVAMEAAVALAAREWADGCEVRWEELIVSSADRPEIGAAAQAMAASVYRPVQTEADAQDRVRISLHAAFWQLYELGQEIDGMSPAIAASIISDLSEYLREHEKPVSHPDLQTAWVQGSVRRMTDLVCAEMKARFVGQDAPTAQEIEEVLAVARAGFEGVESYAQHILAPRAPSPGPVDSP